jgi:hemolysin D
VGGVVTSAQELMKIVPEHATLEAEVTLQNKDIGFIHEGQMAEVKVDTFNFTRYGLIDAEVRDIGEDAVANEQLGWVFPMHLTLKQDTIEVEGKVVHLSPGMSITAEVKTGERRLIEFFLSPLLRYKSESVRER